MIATHDLSNTLQLPFLNLFKKPEKKTTEVEKETHIHTSPTSKGADSKTSILAFCFFF